MNKVEIEASFHKDNSTHPFMITIWGNGYSAYYHLTGEEFANFMNSADKAMWEQVTSIVQEIKE